MEELNEEPQIIKPSSQPLANVVPLVLVGGKRPTTYLMETSETQVKKKKKD